MLGRPLSRVGWCLALPHLLWACSSQPLHHDGAPDDPAFDVSSVPDAIPRPEPRSPYGNPPSYVVDGTRYAVLDSADGYVQRGTASWYGTKFHGQRTSSGEPYDMYAMTAAHKTLPLPSYARVTNLRNGRSVVVKVNDRGPFVKERLIDLSYVAARKLSIVGTGTAPVEVRAISTGATSARSAAITSVGLGDEGAHDRLYLQVGAFASLDNAERLRARLEGMGLADIRIQEGSRDQRPVYRVQIGPLPGAEEAGRVAAYLASNGLEGAQIVTD